MGNRKQVSTLGNQKTHRKRNTAIMLAILLALLVSSLGVAVGYRILTVEGVVTIEEAIQLDKETFSILLYPGETHNETITLTNLSSASLGVTLVLTSDPGVNVSVVPVSGIVVPGLGSITVDVQAHASNSAAPGDYNVHIDLDR